MKKVEGKVKSWGIRYQVPAPILKGIGLEVGDEVEWDIVKEDDGKKVAILKKKEGVKE